MGIVYMQYWLQADAEVTFLRHLEVLKGFYFSPQPRGQYQGGNHVDNIKEGNLLLLFL